MSRPPLRALLVDLSGTIHIGGDPTPRAAQAISRLRDAHIPVRFCSNTSNESSRALVDRLHGMDIIIRDGELWTSLRAVTTELKSRSLSRPYIIASKSAKEEILGANGSNVREPYDSVVVAYTPSQFDYPVLNTAFRVLTHELPSQQPTPHTPVKPIPLLATHASRYVQDTDGHLSLGPGPFVATLEYGAGIKAQVLGKPQKAFYDLVLGSLGTETSGGAIAMVGDDVQGDLTGGAIECGLWRVLVRTGKYRPGDETRPGIQPPDEVFESFADFVDSLLHV
ncbi:hypothetical protein EVG20_g6132 [Dentipellis fragilis]|uniref:Haloacid dehalogenase-like hydrolase domain-containing protein 2 n=1 Tax=Dentipellis fragilis TaxID=205917 RepID=A0A4Y9YP55_9AGAM|nr:hypothetical protein EVG20_g6132 [Dentipellis fragilis]